MNKYKRTILAVSLAAILLFSGCSNGGSVTAASSAPAAAATPEAPMSSAAADGAADSAMFPNGQNQQAPITPQEGILTGGEWNDNQNFDYLSVLMDTHPEWASFSRMWDITLGRRVTVVVTAADQPVKDATVQLLDGQSNIIWTAKTDNTGTAYLFNNVGVENENLPATIRTVIGDWSTDQAYKDADRYEIFADTQSASSAQVLDLMLVMDTTGSMGDELAYLGAELESVIKQVRSDNANIPVRLSVNAYRDIEDDYVVKPNPFSEKLDQSLNFLKEQRADGGGDFEEAVELALDDAINGHEWSHDAAARILLLVLDAPPHNTQENVERMQSLMVQASAQGIRVIPVASSGIDKDTEFLLRSLSVTTGGTYVFLTDDSGVGEAHLEPTIGTYEVELLNDMLVRIINGYLA